MLLFWALWRLLDSKISLVEIQDTWQNLSFGDTILILISFLFVPINWGFEALKWQLLMKPISSITYKNAYKAVLLGTTMGNLSPFMIGDFLGRTSFLPSQKRVQASGALLYGHGIQTMVLLFFAWVICPFLAPNIKLENNAIITLWMILSILLLIGILFYAKKLRFSFVFKITPFSLLELYNFKANSSLFLLSAIRHLVFTFQFIILLFVFKIKLKFFTLFSLVSLVFLFKTIGSFAGVVGDMLGRQLSTVYFFNFFNIPTAEVLSASTLLWFVNLFLPMVFGALFVKHIFTNKSIKEAKI